MSKPIYPDYKGNYKGKLPILRHTKVRRPMSRWVQETEIKIPFLKTLVWGDNCVVVQDIKTGLDNPLTCTPTDWYKKHLLYGSELKKAVRQQKSDWNEWHKDMEEQMFDEYAELKPEVLKSIKKRRLPKIDSIWLWSSKPSLLTRIKRIGRKNG